MIRHLTVLMLMMTSTLMYSQNGRSINGEGETVKREISLSDLNAVGLGIAADVILTHGSPQKIVIEGQQNIIDNIRKEVKNGMWNIYYEQNVREAKDVRIYITLDDLRSVSVAGSGHIRGTNRFPGLDDIDLHVSGSGGITLEYEASSSDVALSGSGELDLSGKSKELSIAISGSGEVDATRLEATSCEVSISGSGDASVKASTSLEAAISGSGDVRYMGSPSVTSHVSGSGSVSKVN